jgi:hypothetical protein
MYKEIYDETNNKIIGLKSKICLYKLESATANKRYFILRLEGKNLVFLLIFVKLSTTLKDL